MKLLALSGTVAFVAGFLSASVSAQTLAPTPSASDQVIQLQALTRKIDEQNVKIDLLSQQILKLEQQISTPHVGVMIGEATPAASNSVSAEPSAHTANGSTHVVARGETLTSIAKMHSVTVSDLQKFNHIENDRKLQIGQTIMIPGSPTPAPAASSPPN
jgi:LysM repeat protein